MKKIGWKKLVPLALGGIILLLVGSVILKFYVLSPKMRPAPVMSASTSPEAVERGRYLVNNVAACATCHSEVQEETPGDPIAPGRLGAGRDFKRAANSPIHLRAPNLTPDKETGLGGWTDGEVARAIREGVSKDGKTLFPQMPYTTYREILSDGETLDMIAYLRTLKPIKNDAGRTEANFPISMFIRGVPQPLETSPPPAPSPGDRIARGKWLLRMASCDGCHDSIDSHMQKIPGKGYAGGFKFNLPNDKGFVIAPNISSDKATGVGAYSDDDIRRAIEEGKGKSGQNLLVMPWSAYKGMTKEDKDALIAALREVTPVANIVAASEAKR